MSRAYVVSQPRPARAGIDRDYPDLLLKPVDAALRALCRQFPAGTASLRPVRADPCRDRQC